MEENWDFMTSEMVMTTGNSNISGINLEPPGIDDIFRSSPEPGSYYRCPVSTPLHPKRPPHQKIPESITFVSLDFSKVQGDPRQNVHKGLPAGKKIMPRRKNMDCYYIDKSFQKRIAEQSNSTWLRSLCAQPVDEIFTKYRQHRELRRQQSSLRASTTPGERAIFEAWESNSSRLGSAASVCSRYSASTQKTFSPQLTLISKSYRPPPSTAPVSRNDSVVDSHLHPPSIGEDQDLNEANSRITSMKNSPPLNLPMDVNPYVDERFYDQFKRQEPRFPDIHKKSSLMNKQRKYLSYGDQYNISTSPRDKSPVPFTGALTPRKKIPTMTRSKTCTLCLWEEDPPAHLQS